MNVYFKEPCYATIELSKAFQITCDKEAKEEDKEVDNKDGCLAKDG